MLDFIINTRMNARERRQSKSPIIVMMIAVFVIMTLAIAVTKPAKAESPYVFSKWEHSSNPERGMSLMLMGYNPNNGAVGIVYDMPRTSLLDIGIRPGMVLFEGNRNGDSFTGTAYVFACGQTWPYRVAGYYTDGRLRLQGAAPIIERDYNDHCYVARYSYTDRNANLLFWFRGIVQ